MSEASASSAGTAGERRELGEAGPRVMKIAAAVGAAGLALTIAIGFAVGGMHGVGLAYLSGFAFWLSISLGALFFVIIQHLTRAGWSVTVRRVAEIMAANLCTLAVLAVPLLVMMAWVWRGWMAPAEPLPGGKAAWFGPMFFIARLVVYFGVWIGLAWWLWRHSVEQDYDRDPAHTDTVQRYSGLAVVLYALSVNFGAMDLLMSLDPHWYSTIFGVYFFTGGFLGFFAAVIVMLRCLQRRGVMTESVTVEHYHDLGKWLFGFVFFWGYIAFSQFMLQWYGNLPEETQWYARRGSETATELTSGGWGWVSVLLLFGHFLIPFSGLLSRWMKRWLGFLLFWAVWLLIFHFLDVAWLVMPELGGEAAGGAWAAVAAALCGVVGVGGIWVAGLMYLAGRHMLTPAADPRLDESLAFQNF